MIKLVIQGSNNVELEVYIVENGKPSPLSGSTVSIKLRAGGRIVIKSATVKANGLVSTLLTSDDLSTSGTYFVQVNIAYSDGRLFKSEPVSFTVGEAL